MKRMIISFTVLMWHTTYCLHLNLSTEEKIDLTNKRIEMLKKHILTRQAEKNNLESAIGLAKKDDHYKEKLPTLKNRLTLISAGIKQLETNKDIAEKSVKSLTNTRGI